MIQRQIEALERQNELDQRRIDGLRREDEIRNRVANALNHELDIMAQQEQKIRDAYDKRVKALEKVKQLNSNIIQQQRDQLNITRALGTGDIFEATAAAQQMQQNQVQFAQDQTGAAMQQGMENQIAGLRTEGGLTRQQAEQQIADIKEQSYQTGLQIQAIEDNIYNRNLQMIPLKDAIYNLDLQIQGVSDQIYNRETEILNIQNTRLDPLQQALDNEQKILNAKNEAFENDIAAQELAIERNKIADEQVRLTTLLSRKTSNLANIWHDVTKQIFKANELMNNSLAGLGGAPQIAPDETASDFAARVGEYTSAVAAIKKRRDDSVAAAKKVGVDAMKAMGGGNRGLFAGGYVKKYAQGNYVLGSGGRDSVPAMLTPGEFIIRKAAVDKFGVPMLNSLNMGSMPKYNVPGRVFAGGSNRFDESGRRNNGGMMDSPVYNNYTVNVNVAGTNASADDIATRAVTKIREMQNMQIRGNRAY
jgi:hypothetical protein